MEDVNGDEKLMDLSLIMLHFHASFYIAGYDNRASERATI